MHEEMMSSRAHQMGMEHGAQQMHDDLLNAGAEWVNQEVVQDGNLISSRGPNDLPAFCRAIIAALA